MDTLPTAGPEPALEAERLIDEHRDHPRRTGGDRRRASRRRLAEAREFQQKPDLLAEMEREWGSCQPGFRALVRLGVPRAHAARTRRPVRARRRGAGRPRARRAASRSAGGGSSDPDEPEPGELRRSNVGHLRRRIGPYSPDRLARRGVVA